MRERVYAVSADEPLPWEAGHTLRSVPLKPGFVWQHVVYGGAYALRATRDTLLGVFGESDEDHDGRMDGETALFALTVTDHGRLLLDSPVLSTCAWATGRALSPGPGSRSWLDGFDEEAGIRVGRAVRCSPWGESSGCLLTAFCHTPKHLDSAKSTLTDGSSDDDAPEYPAHAATYGPVARGRVREWAPRSSARP